ncbi:MAG: hypothetical protein H6942_11850 [Candidatus Accumulibacter sp.]|uniref:HAD family hydrolase n=1 Tax=Accumulibacter sp. TaxID=2053492 RepID=UPI0025DD09D9|nr:hypothetical protein [Accumulibacter sp.]MCP5249206.1 hypothetical protein [Accumulibacter sp.]
MALIDRAEVVSFDIFDTALVRPFAAPDHLFWFLERKAGEVLGAGQPPFRQVRIESEREARMLATLPEITLAEIYRRAEARLALAADTLAPLMSLELALEHACCRRRDCVGELYDYTLTAGKTVFFTSDTYLDESVIDALLRAKGFDGRHQIIVSSVHRATKHDGPLFRELHRQAGVARRKILHIGDNFRSDCLMAWRNGIPSLHVPSPIHNFSLNPRNLEVLGLPRLPWRLAWRSRLSSVNAHLSGWMERPELSLMAGLTANRHYDAAPPGPGTASFFAGRWDVLGYTAFGPLLLGFALWLVDQFRTHGIDQAHFLSRDGKIMKDAFDLIAEAIGVNVESSYTYCSRRAVNFARITALDHRALQFLCDSSAQTSVSDHLARIQFDPAAFADQIHAAGFSSPDQIVTIADRPRLEALFRAIEADIVDRARWEREDLLAYYRKKGLTDSPGVAIIDIGWWGTMYRSLAELLSANGKAPELKAFYFGTFAEADQLRLANLAHEAYFVRYGEPLDLFSDIKKCIEIVELFFSATHGTFIKIAHQSQDLSPLLDACDCTPLRDDAIDQMQGGAVSFIRDALVLGDGLKRLRLSPYDLSQPLRALLTAPTPEEVEPFETLVHFQDIGKNAVERRIVTRLSALQLVLFPMRFARQLSLSYWKTGSIRRLPLLSRVYLSLLMHIRERLTRRL